MLPFLGEYLYVKNKRYRSITSEDIDDQGTLQSDWMTAFWPVTCEPNFFQIWGLHRKAKNNIDFHFWLLPAKSNDKIFQ